jgi:hypothetical protein
MRQMISDSKIWKDTKEVQRTLWGFVAGMLGGDIIRVLWAEIRDEEPLDTLRRALESAAASGSSIGGWLSEYHGWRSGRLTGSAIAVSAVARSGASQISRRSLCALSGCLTPIMKPCAT